MEKQFTDDNFKEEVIEASKSKPILVDFFAPWCGPCKIMGPIIEEVAEAVKEKAIVGKLNTEEAQATAQEYGIMSIPTLILFKDGKPKQTMVGLQTKEALIELIKNNS